MCEYDSLKAGSANGGMILQWYCKDTTMIPQWHYNDTTVFREQTT